MRTNFFNKIVFGSFILYFSKLVKRKTHIIMLTIPEDRITPITPKLKGNKFLTLLIGAPIKNQSKKTFSIIPAKDN